MPEGDWIEAAGVNREVPFGNHYAPRLAQVDRRIGYRQISQEKSPQLLAERPREIDSLHVEDALRGLRPRQSEHAKSSEKGRRSTAGGIGKALCPHNRPRAREVRAPRTQGLPQKARRIKGPCGVGPTFLDRPRSVDASLSGVSIFQGLKRVKAGIDAGY
jgi:hypothetical protein